jgi:glutathione S-transferase
MKLLGSSRSPYVQKVRIALAEKGIAYDFSESSPASDEVTTANPLAKIPTLVRDNGEGLYDSCVIIEYLDGFKGNPSLIPTDFEPRIEARRWEALGNGIMDATVAISHELRLPESQQKGPDFFSKQKRKIDSALDIMNTDLGTNEFCVGSKFTLADIACVAALIYLDRAMPEYDWRSVAKNLARHLETISTRPSLNGLL